jgi:CheY-like chemotaxis protein
MEDSSRCASDPVAFLNPPVRTTDDGDMARVLVIDDEQAIGHVIRLLLESQGHQVLVADDGSRGFALAQRQAPDVVILDVMMPVMDGFAVLEAFRRDPRTAELPIVMLSALTAEDVEERCIELGAAAYVRKPFRADDLLGALSTVLSVTDPVAAPGVGPARD